VLLSALLHPIRDLTLKGAPNPTTAYLSVTIVWIAIAGAHAAIGGQELMLPTAAWPFVVISSVGLTIYYYGSLAALRRGNLSVNYPIIRSSSLAIVVFNWLLFEQVYSFWALAGIGLIVCASLAIQKAPGSFFADWRALLLAFMAMVASAAYAVAVARAMQHAPPAAFLFWCYSLVSILLLLVCLVEQAHKPPAAPNVRQQHCIARIESLLQVSAPMHHII
jgi:drug/metabolite transporter (DMT)-like permease